MSGSTSQSGGWGSSNDTGTACRNVSPTGTQPSADDSTGNTNNAWTTAPARNHRTSANNNNKNTRGNANNPRADPNRWGKYQGDKRETKVNAPSRAPRKLSPANSYMPTWGDHSHPDAGKETTTDDSDLTNSNWGNLAPTPGSPMMNSNRGHSTNSWGAPCLSKEPQTAKAWEDSNLAMKNLSLAETAAVPQTSTSPPSVEASDSNGETEEGVIISMKDTFGFIACFDRDGDLFYKLTEASEDIQIGDEVRFIVIQNPQTKKCAAVKVQKLSQVDTLKKSTESTSIPKDTTTPAVVDGNNNMWKKSSQIQQDASRKEKTKPANVPIQRLKLGRGIVRKAMSNSSSSHLVEIIKSKTFTDGEIELESEQHLRRRERQVIEYNQESLNWSLHSKEIPPLFLPHHGDLVEFEIVSPDAASTRVTNRYGKNRNSHRAKRAAHLKVVKSCFDTIDKAMENFLPHLEREMGSVVKIYNDQSGYLQCCDRNEHLFFQQRKPEVGEDLAARVPLRVGDEVEFKFVDQQDVHHVLPDFKMPKFSRGYYACEVTPIPKGTISTLAMVGKNIRGRISRVTDIKKNKGIGTVHAYGELVRHDEPNQDLSFLAADIHDPTYFPFLGDFVTFDLVVNKRNNVEEAKNIRLEKLNLKSRDYGVIHSLKKDFGFIKCTEHLMDAYFQFRDIIGSTPGQLRVGQSVYFCVEKNPVEDRLLARMIQYVPAHDVKWEIPMPPRRTTTDISDKVQEPPQAAKKIKGNICFIPLSNPLRTRVFGRIRVPSDQYALCYFPDLYAHVRAFEISSSQIEEGSVYVLETDAPLTKNERFFVRQYCKRPGSTIKCQVDDGRDHVALVKKHTTGYRAMEENVEELLVEEEAKTDPKKKKKKEEEEEETPPLSPCGKDDTQMLELEFEMRDILTSRYTPEVGDEVAFFWTMDKRSKAFYAREIDLVTKVVETLDIEHPYIQGRGFVTGARQDFGFIFDIEQKSSFYFHTKDTMVCAESNVRPKLVADDEVSFVLKWNARREKYAAYDIERLERGTIPYEVDDEEAGSRVFGIVMKPPGSSSSERGKLYLVHTDAGVYTSGSSSSSPPVGLQPRDHIWFQSQDVLDNEHPSKEQSSSRALEAGDRVCFSIKRHLYKTNPSANRRAVEISVLARNRRSGRVLTLDQKTGLGTLSTTTESSCVRLALCYVQGSVPLMIHDEVEFVSFPMTHDPEVHLAAHIRVCGSTPEQTSSSSVVPTQQQQQQRRPTTTTTTKSEKPTSRAGVNPNLLKVLRETGVDGIVQSRVAKGPDGSRGFWASVPGYVDPDEKKKVIVSSKSPVVVVTKEEEADQEWIAVPTEVVNHNEYANQLYQHGEYDDDDDDDFYPTTRKGQKSVQ